jgi:hypothetical protein
MDIKVFCMRGKNGLTSFFQVDVDRHGSHRRNFYDKDWSRVSMEMEYPGNPVDVPRPENLEKMMNIADQLSRGFPFVRIDLYEYRGKVFFGEMTFMPEAANAWFRPPEWNRRFGDLIDLPPRAEA